jgi:hypothetical protein
VGELLDDVATRDPILQFTGVGRVMALTLRSAMWSSRNNAFINLQKPRFITIGGYIEHRQSCYSNIQEDAWWLCASSQSNTVHPGNTNKPASKLEQPEPNDHQSDAAGRIEPDKRCNSTPAKPPPLNLCQGNVPTPRFELTRHVRSGSMGAGLMSRSVVPACRCLDIDSSGPKLLLLEDPKKQ